MDTAEAIAPAAEQHRERSGGRQSRREKRSGGPVGIYPPYIKRNIPTYDILSEENLQKVEARLASNSAMIRRRWNSGARRVRTSPAIW